MKGLVTSNTHVQYESPINSGKKVMGKVKVFVHASNADADADTRAIYDISSSDICPGPLKIMVPCERSCHKEYTYTIQEAQRATYRAPEYNVPPFWRIGQGGHLVFPIGPKNTNLVEDVEILLPVKFH